MYRYIFVDAHTSLTELHGRKAALIPGSLWWKRSKWKMKRPSCISHLSMLPENWDPAMLCVSRVWLSFTPSTLFSSTPTPHFCYLFSQYCHSRKFTVSCLVFPVINLCNTHSLTRQPAPQQPWREGRPGMAHCYTHPPIHTRTYNKLNTFFIIMFVKSRKTTEQISVESLTKLWWSCTLETSGNEWRWLFFVSLYLLWLNLVSDSWRSCGGSGDSCFSQKGL